VIEGDFQAPNWLDLQRLHHNQFKLDKLRVKHKTAPEIWNAVLAA
jgi:hypothetical protein